ncbi:MAG TPA: hypothetical protein DCY88_08505 [Cyanobacteria bacterium UBA11372]|nr:hypothetical protein [Cyanobacteria bacterium UBA11372]
MLSKQQTKSESYQANTLAYQVESNSASPLVTIQPNGRKRPFFLVLGGVGGVDGDIGLAVAARLLIHLDSERPFYGLRASILDGELNPYAPAEYPPAEVLAADYIKAIRAFQPDGPYLLGGDCLAGIVAFEMAQQLVAQGQKVALLVLLDTSCPTETTCYNDRLPRKIPATIIYHLNQLWHIEPGKRLSYFFDKAMNAFKLYLLRDREAWKARFYAHLWQQYSTTLLRYRPQTYSGRIALLLCEALYRQNPTQGWSNVAPEGLEIYMFPGEHTTYIKEHAQAIAEQLSLCFDAAEAENLKPPVTKHNATG